MCASRFRIRLYFRLMETFFILFALVFGLFFWYLSRAFQYTQETVGENAPIYRERTYQFTASEYFIDFLKIANPVMVFMMLVLAFITGKAAIRQEEPLLFIFSPIFLGFAGMFCFYIYFDWHYWTITRNVLVTFSPLEKSITVDDPIQYSVLTSDNVTRIEHHIRRSNNSKDPLGVMAIIYFTHRTAKSHNSTISSSVILAISNFWSASSQTLLKRLSSTDCRGLRILIKLKTRIHRTLSPDIRVR